MRCLFIRRHKYRSPEVRTVALEGDCDILVGSRIEGLEGTMTSVGQPVEKYDFETGVGGIKNEDLDWNTSFE